MSRICQISKTMSLWVDGRTLHTGLAYVSYSGYHRCLIASQNRKQSWWLVLADDKTNRIVVPPMKITDVPFSNPTSDRNFRSYKMQFQAPQGVGLFTWKVCLISDTFVGEEVSRDLGVRKPRH